MQYLDYVSDMAYYYCFIGKSNISQIEKLLEHFNQNIIDLQNEVIENEKIKVGLDFSTLTDGCTLISLL